MSNRFLVTPFFLNQLSPPSYYLLLQESRFLAPVLPKLVQIALKPFFFSSPSPLVYNNRLAGDGDGDKE
jgi:hypothetical protein